MHKACMQEKRKNAILFNKINTHPVPKLLLFKELEWFNTIPAKIIIELNFLKLCWSLEHSYSGNLHWHSRKMRLVEKWLIYSPTAGQWYNWILNSGLVSMDTVLLRAVLMIQKMFWYLWLSSFTTFITEMWSYWLGCSRYHLFLEWLS